MTSQSQESNEPAGYILLSDIRRMDSDRQSPTVIEHSWTTTTIWFTGCPY